MSYTEFRENIQADGTPKRVINNEEELYERENPSGSPGMV
jgi:hypothetical protein